MKNSFSLLFVLSLFTISASWAEVDQTKMIEQSNAEAQATYKDIKETLGSVPSYLKNFPESGITGAWMDMKGIQLNKSSAIPGKYKELIGLAVSAQVPCRFCTYFHTAAAKLNNANDIEISESIALAASARRWGAFLTGTQVDEGKYKNEINKMLKFTNTKRNLQAMEEKPSMQEVSMNTAQDAYNDMKNTFGFVPSFVKTYPESGVVGLWKEFKGISLNPLTAIPGKYKHLIGLAVAGQMPCSYCIYYSTQAAIMEGATPAEINEAVAMGGVTRQWSTVLNGQYTDEKRFRSETDQIMKFLKTKMSKEVGMSH
jgi:AhpD family alkylhydroperoxidase